jgi:hydroxypyruvate isomerase
MPRFAANLSLLYPEHKLVDRFAAAARDGFAAVEVQAPYELPAEEFRRALLDAKLQLVLMNAPAGDAAKGERGLAALPGREADFERSVVQALDYVRCVGAPRVHVMAGIAPAEARPDEVRAAYLRNLRHAAAVLGAAGVEVVIEPINTRDVPGYWLTHQQQAAEVIDAAGSASLGLQMDFYHLQIMEGDLLRHWQRHRARVRHVQVAGVPDRHEPDGGEVNYAAVLAALDAAGYRGWVGCEYRPARGAVAGGTSAGLGWMRTLV